MAFKISFTTSVFGFVPTLPLLWTFASVRL